MIGPAMDTALSRYLAGPVVPTVLGHDARLQLLHEQDALGALERAAMAGKAGTFNVGASGIIMLSQAIRRSGRVPLPVPGFGAVGGGFAGARYRYTELDREQLNYLSYGRVMDTTACGRIWVIIPSGRLRRLSTIMFAAGIDSHYRPGWVRSLEVAPYQRRSALVARPEIN